jgi:hypothetical protein
MSVNEDYLIMSEVLRKLDTNENYEPTDYERKIVVSLLEMEDEYTVRRSKYKKYSQLDS